MPEFDLDAALNQTQVTPLVCPVAGCGGAMVEDYVDADTDDYGRFTDEFTIWSKCVTCDQHVDNVYKLAGADFGSGRSPEYDATCEAAWLRDRHCPVCSGLTKIDFDVDTEDIKDSVEEGERFLRITCIGVPGDDDQDEEQGCGVSWTAVYKFDRATTI